MTPSICHHVVSRQLDTESYPEKVLTCQQAYGPILRRSRDFFVKEITHGIHEDHPGLFPCEWLQEPFGA
jgi:hypothetical protein